MDRLKFIFLYFSFGLSFLNFRGQEIINYVNNPSFEQLLPSALTNYNDAARFWGPLDTNSAATYILSKTLGTVPYAFGFQYPRTGNNFVLSQFYCATTTCSNSARWYPRNRLKQLLKANTEYCAKYYTVNTNNCTVGIDSYGILLGSSVLDTIKYCSIPLTYLNPQIEYQNGIISDTLMWVSISGTFVAVGNEKYMVLGNFKSNTSTNTLIINPTYLPSQSADVFIDDVSLIELNLPAFAGKDTTFFLGDSLFLGREPDIGIDEACIWFKMPNMTFPIDTVAGFWVKPTETSTYVLRQEICGLVKWDTVTLYEDAVGLGKLQWYSGKISLFPNPTSENLSISFSGSTPPDNISYNITDNLGQDIGEGNLIGNSSSVSTSGLAPGVYQIHLKTSFGTVTKKFIKAD